MSAKRFGGTYSPGGAPRSAAEAAQIIQTPRSYQPRTRAWWLYIFPTPILLAALSALSAGAAIRMTVLLFSYACLMLGAWLLREGQRAHAEYDAREISRPPAFPRKLFAAGLAGIGVMIASWMSKTTGGFLEFGAHMITSVVFGVLTAGAHVVAFGIDPLKAKGTGTNAIGAAELDRVADALDEAEAKLRTIEALAHRMRDKDVDERVKSLNATVREMLRMIERDPRDLSRAKRYLSVYLKGAEEATRKYAENQQHLQESQLRHDYLELLSDLEQSFSRGKEAMLVDNRTDLEVEIEVLRDRLGQESA